jgi:hypothetical protein
MYFEAHGRSDFELGRRVSDMTAQLLQNAQADLAHTNSPLSHVSYEELIREPVETVKKVYDRFGWTYTEQYEQRLLQYIEQNNAKRKQQQQQRDDSGSGSCKERTPGSDVDKESLQYLLGADELVNKLNWSTTAQNQGAAALAGAGAGAASALHQYSCSEFGLTEDDLSSGVFAAYGKQFCN